MDDKQLAALVRKNMAKASRPKTDVRKKYDATLDATQTPETDADLDRKDFFSEMKKREF